MFLNLLLIKKYILESVLSYQADLYSISFSLNPAKYAEGY